MITEIVNFSVPRDMAREEVAALFGKSAPGWRANPDLIRKYYLYDSESSTAGGVYLWKEKAHALKWHGEEFSNRIREAYGSEPRFQYFETPLIVDNGPA